VPAVVSELLRDLQTSGGMWDFWGMFHHRVAPSEVFTPERFGAVAARVAGTPLEPQVMAELAFMTEGAEQRAALAAAPCFADDGHRLTGARAV
ncbi:MAG: hypothetical protein ACRDYV_13105, partial [Acidimicrobiia bacterium]